MSDAPKIFGKPLVLQALPGRPLYVLPCDQGLNVSVFQRSGGEWSALVEGLHMGPFMSSSQNSAQEAALDAELRIRELVLALAAIIDVDTMDAISLIHVTTT